MSTPTVGRTVHYVSHGTPIGADGSQAYPSACRTAFVTEVDPSTPDRVGLMVANPTGVFFHSLADGGSRHHDGAEIPGDPGCPSPDSHGDPFRYCSCGWSEATLVGGTWHWPERV